MLTQEQMQAAARELLRRRNEGHDHTTHNHVPMVDALREIQRFLEVKAAVDFAMQQAGPLKAPVYPYGPNGQACAPRDQA